VGEIKSITLELDEGGSKTDWWNPVLKLCCKNFLFVFGNHIVLSIESWERDICIEGGKPKNFGTYVIVYQKENQEKKNKDHRL
jgi:hypothetical protein